MKRKILLLTVLSLVMCLALTGCGKKEEEKKNNSNNENQTAITNNENNAEPKNTEEPNNKENNQNTTDNENNNNTNTVNDDIMNVKLTTDDKRLVIDTPQGKIVITHEGEKITGSYLYVNYVDEATAKAAAELLKQENKDEQNIKSIKVEGTYVVVEYVEEEYEDISFSDLQSLVGVYN